jgi:hypothetical protein
MVMLLTFDYMTVYKRPKADLCEALHGCATAVSRHTPQPTGEVPAAATDQRLTRPTDLHTDIDRDIEITY